MIIQHNMLMMNNCRIGKQLQVQKSKVMEKLSSGYRINRAADDAAGLAISEKMNARIRSLNRCQNNIEEGISLAQTADSALHEVNNMLNRVSELCVQAANDTNTIDDRAKIAAEISQIYDDMDRIFETTEFNTIPVFRHDGNNFYGPKAKYLYHEKVTVLPPDDFSSWGTGAFPTKTFDMAKGATKATATLTFGTGINANDVSSLNGTSFFIKNGSSVTAIAFGTEQSTGSISGGYYINTSSYSTVQAAFDRVNSYMSAIDEIQVNGNRVTFTFYSTTKTNTITADGNTAIEYVEDGSVGNGHQIYTAGNTLKPIDAGTASSNAVVFDTTATQTVTLFHDKSANDTLTAGEIADLRQNTLSVYPFSGIKVTDLLTLDANTTVGEIRQAVATKLDSNTNCDVVYNSANGSMEITLTCSDTSKSAYAYLYESNNTETVYKENTSAPSITVVQTQQATAEQQAKYIITVDEINDNKAYSFELNGTTHIVYDTNDYTGISYDSTYSQPYTSYRSATGTKTKQEKIYEIIKSYSSNYYVNSLPDGSLELTSKQYNDNSLSIADSPVEFQLRNTSDDVLLTDSSAMHYYKQNYSVSIDFSSALGDSFDITGLYGTGFMLNDFYYQFTGTGDQTPLYNNKTTAISLAGVSDYAGLCSKLAVATGLTVEENLAIPTTLIIKGSCKTDDSSGYAITFTDGGPRGTFTNSVTSSGGAAYKNPQAEIDFSQYDMQNLDELYGTGFRITCATCPGEFINVMFCHDKSELNYPDSFEFTDDQGNQNTIHNYMVELKDVTDASQIAANIADQLKNDLDHFTEVKVSDTNPSVLVAQDKRSKDQPGRAQILAGVYTNFTYHVDAEKIPDMSELVDGGKKGTDAYYSYCMIYAADSTEKPYIAVHLPVFTVENLKLENPANGFETYEQITNILKQSRNAAEVVSMARSKIGADQNRLEHALSYAENAEEQLTAAASRIRDLDMAKGVSELAKLELLSNVQQSLLSQLADQPQRILSLLQQ